MSGLDDRLACRVVAVANDHSALLKAIRQRIEELNLNHETVEALAGIQPGYLSKVIADPPQKRAGPFIWFLILGALGLDVHLAENPQAVERLKSRWEKRKIKPKSVQAKAGIIQLTPNFCRRRARAGGFARQALPNASELNRAAARARWASS